MGRKISPSRLAISMFVRKPSCAGARKDPRPAVSAVRMRPVQARVKSGCAHMEDAAARSAGIGVGLVQQVGGPPEEEEGPTPGRLRRHDLDVDLRRLAGEGHPVRRDAVSGERVEDHLAVLVAAEEAVALNPHVGIEPAQVRRDVVARPAGREMAAGDEGRLVLGRVVTRWRGCGR